jgi:hypothetical protein
MTDSTYSDFPVEGLIARRRPNENRTAVAASHSRTRPKADLPKADLPKANLAKYRWRPLAKLLSLTFSGAIVAALWIGWSGRNDSGLTPESGLGYWLGITGSTLMLLVLVYPLRKRMPSWRAIGTVPFWFRAHMVLGISGCVLVLWHANFTLGAINSNVALITMLVVTTSGIFGWYLYSQVHVGLHGHKTVVQEILADVETLKGFIGANPPVARRLLKQMNEFARLGTAAPKGILAGLVFMLLISWRGTVVRMQLIADARQVIALEGRRRGWSRRIQREQLASVADLVTLHVAAVRKAATFAFYERLFRLWHIFHVPLFILLVIVAIIHVFAAHFF